MDSRKLKLLECGYTIVKGTCREHKCLCINPQSDHFGNCSCGHKVHIHYAEEHKCKCRFFVKDHSKDGEMCLCGHLNIYHALPANVLTPEEPKINGPQIISEFTAPLPIKAANESTSTMTTRTALKRGASSLKEVEIGIMPKRRSMMVAVPVSKYIPKENSPTEANGKQLAMADVTSTAAVNKTVIDVLPNRKASNSDANQKGTLNKSKNNGIFSDGTVSKWHQSVGTSGYRKIKSYFSFIGMPAEHATSILTVYKYAKSIRNVQNIANWLHSRTLSKSTFADYVKRVQSLIRMMKLPELSESELNLIYNYTYEDDEYQTISDPEHEKAHKEDANEEELDSKMIFSSFEDLTYGQIGAYLSFLSIPDDEWTKDALNSRASTIKNISNITAWLKSLGTSKRRPMDNLRLCQKLLKKIGLLEFTDNEIFSITSALPTSYSKRESKRQTAGRTASYVETTEDEQQSDASSDKSDDDVPIEESVDNIEKQYAESEEVEDEINVDQDFPDIYDYLRFLEILPAYWDSNSIKRFKYDEKIRSTENVMKWLNTKDWEPAVKEEHTGHVQYLLISFNLPVFTISELSSMFDSFYAAKTVHLACIPTVENENTNSFVIKAETLLEKDSLSMDAKTLDINATQNDITIQPVISNENIPPLTNNTTMFMHNSTLSQVEQSKKSTFNNSNFVVKNVVVDEKNNYVFREDTPIKKVNHNVLLDSGKFSTM